MITELDIFNLKSVKYIEMECSDINLFIGTNSSGKSTILQGLLFCIQNIEEAKGLNGEFIKLGKLEENRCIYSSDKTIKARISDDDNKEMIFELVQIEDGKYGLKKSGNIISEKYSFKQRKVQYLSCHRVGPLKAYEKDLNFTETIGINGQYAIAYLNEHGSEPLSQNICKGNIDYTLLGQVNWWLSYIVGAEVRTEEIIGADLVQALYNTKDINRIRPENIGSGISYLISVLIMCLSSPEESVLVIENPEIHLHPSAQAKVCEFIYFISESGRQFFIESHSDHIFNGFRAGIASGEMKNEKINMQFIRLNGDNITENMRVIVGRMGRIENQCKDLFDQFDLDMNKMIGI